MYTVVIIEDDPMITRLNRRYVEQDSRFAVVQTFSAAHPALFWLQRNPIDLIILDVYMPQMSGTELLLQLRAEGVDADVIMVTSANDAKTVNDAVRVGAVDYLVKPFDSAQITACLRKLNLLPESRPAVCGDKPGNTFCTQFSVWLEHHYMQDVSLDQAAEAMGMSSFYFSRFFRTSYNQTFLEYLTAYRIDRAVELLQQTDIPVREIAVRVGYTDANYFTKVFKRHLGVTPTEYRNHNAN